MESGLNQRGRAKSVAPPIIRGFVKTAIFLDVVGCDMPIENLIFFDLTLRWRHSRIFALGALPPLERQQTGMGERRCNVWCRDSAGRCLDRASPGGQWATRLFDHLSLHAASLACFARRQSEDNKTSRGSLGWRSARATPSSLDATARRRPRAPATTLPPR